MQTGMSLSKRFYSLDVRIELLEQRLGVKQSSSVSEDSLRRWRALRLLQQELLCNIRTCENRLAAHTTQCDNSQNLDAGQPDPIHDAHFSVQRRLTLELTKKGLYSFHFRRAPPDYYQQSLEYRRQVLGAECISQLCKSLILENTKARGAAADAQHAAQYVCVVIQYGAKLHAEKVRTFLHKQSNGALGRKQFNMRLANEDESEQLTGYGHNAVTPIGLRTRLPILLSHHIAELRQGFFWMGGGETDLKLGLNVSDFVKAYNAIIVDCTHND